MKFGELPKTANSFWGAVIGGALSLAGALASRKGSGSSSAAQTATRQPAAWEPDMKKLWDDYMRSRSSGARENLAEKYSSVLGGLMSQYLQPAYNIKIGGQTVPVIPRRNLMALDSAAKALAEQYGMELDPIQTDQDLAMAVQGLRYGNNSVTNTGDVNRTPSVLESIGVGTDLFRSIYPAVEGITTTPTTAQVTGENSPYAGYYNGKPLINKTTGKVVAI